MRPFYDEATNLYWVLKGRHEQGIPEVIELGQRFTLVKQALFHYPVGQVLPLCNDDFEALAFCQVLSYEQIEGCTEVRCEVLELLNQEARTALTLYLHTVQRLLR